MEKLRDFNQLVFAQCPIRYDMYIYDFVRDLPKGQSLFCYIKNDFISLVI